jgi:hypothetical protein
MSTFYVLPPRPLLGQRFSEFLTSMFPGLGWDRDVWTELGEALAAAAGSHPDVYVVFREDLPEGELESHLVEQFGAEEGDEVVEVHISLANGRALARRWLLGAHAVKA